MKSEAELTEILRQVEAADGMAAGVGPKVEALIQDELDRSQGLSQPQALGLGLALIGAGAVVLRRWCSPGTAPTVAYGVADAAAAARDYTPTREEWFRLLGLPEDAA